MRFMASRSETKAKRMELLHKFSFRQMFNSDHMVCECGKCKTSLYARWYCF